MLADCPRPGTTEVVNLAAKHAVVECGAPAMVASGRFSRRLPHVGDGARDKNLANRGCAAGVSFYEHRGWIHCVR